MYDGVNIKLGDRGGEFSVRRCFNEQEQEQEQEVVEINYETSDPHWFQFCWCLTPDQALQLGAALVTKGATKLASVRG